MINEPFRAMPELGLGVRRREQVVDQFLCSHLEVCQVLGGG